MIWLSALVAAVAPGLALLSYFYLKDRYESEPISMVIRFFLFGALMVFPLMVLQRAFVLGFGEHPILYSFVYSSFLEEFFKWFLLYFIIYKHSQFNEPYDGIVYATAISLGFATVENVLYVLLGVPSVSFLLMRALLPVSGHALFGVIMGYWMGRAKFTAGMEKRLLLLSLVVPIFYHGLFDYILLHVKQNWIWLMLPLMLFLWVRSLWKMKNASANSPFRGLVLEEEIKA